MSKWWGVVVVLLVVIVGLVYYVSTTRQSIDFGKSCGDLNNQTFADDCCAKRNADSLHIQCVGEWKFIEGKERGASDECQFICSQSIVDNGCAKAGEGDGAPGPNSPIVTCCSGLTKINGCLELRNGVCEPLVGCGGICSDCGNKICETWENKCNCPSDCS